MSWLLGRRGSRKVKHVVREEKIIYGINLVVKLVGEDVAGLRRSSSIG